MGEPLDSMAKILLGALLTWLFAIWRERRRDREARQHSDATVKEGRKRDFLCFIAKLNTRIHDASEIPLPAVHRKSIEELRGECARVADDINRRDDFVAALNRYCEMPDNDVRGKDAKKRLYAALKEIVDFVR